MSISQWTSQQKLVNVYFSLGSVLGPWDWTEYQQPLCPPGVDSWAQKPINKQAPWWIMCNVLTFCGEHQGYKMARRWRHELWRWQSWDSSTFSQENWLSEMLRIHQTEKEEGHCRKGEPQKWEPRDLATSFSQLETWLKIPHSSN